MKLPAKPAPGSIPTDANFYSDFVLNAGAPSPVVSATHEIPQVGAASGAKTGATLPADSRSYTPLKSDERGWALGV